MHTHIGRALGLVLLCIGTPAFAVDLHSLFDAECHRQTGVLLHVDAEDVILVGLDGHMIRQRRDRIQAVVLHSVLENPLATIQVDAPLAAYLRRIWVGNDSDATFSGFATGFHDDLVIFLDLNGKVRVLEPDEIRKMAPLTALGEHRAPASRPLPQLGFPPEVVPCGTSVPAGTEAVPPKYIIADSIKLGDYFGNLEERYQGLDGFEERTRVYAHPFVFDQRSRLGLTYFQDQDLPLPFYFAISAGRAYRFQSYTVIGNAPNDSLPITQPTLTLRSEAKSHFFNASFIGNLAALPAGSDAFALQRLNASSSLNTNPGVLASYNYVLLLGADYWRLSFSGGPAYLATQIIVPPARRSVQGVRASPALRLRYQSDLLDARIVFFHTRESGSLSDVLGNDFSGMGSYDFATDSVRVGATLRPGANLELALDEVVTIGRYSESRTDGGTALNVSYKRLDTGITVSSDFGRYVTVKALIQLLYTGYDAAAGINASFDPRFGGALEFLF
jgi:hypothetical protein